MDLSAAHIHLMLNHIPLVAVPIGVILLGWGLMRNNVSLRKAGLGIFLACALLSIPVYLTGEGAEHAVEELPGVSHDVIEEHEEIAKPAFFGMLALGLLSAGALMASRGQRQGPKWIGSATFILALLMSGLLGYTALQGGKIRHTEIRPGSSLPQENGAVSGEEQEEE